METRAAVAIEAGKPLSIETVQLDGPQESDVVDVSKAVASLKKGRHVIPLYTPECRECEYGTSEQVNLRQELEYGHKSGGKSAIIDVAGVGRTDVPKVVDWYMDGKINIQDLITHKLANDDINEGFDLLHRGESIRAIVEF